MKNLLTSLLATGRLRRQYQSLLNLDDRLLADAGVTRAEITRSAEGRTPLY